jgi:hypothetical protein
MKFSYPKWSKTRKFFITTTLQFCFRIFLLGGSGKKVGLILNETHQLLTNADDVHLLGDDIGTIKRNTETKKKTLWPLVHKQTIPTGRPPLVDEI